MKDRINALVARVMRTRVGRSSTRFFTGQGPLLAAGIAYMALFSLTAAVTVGWTIFSGVLNASPLFKDAVINAANTALPGIFKSPDVPGGVIDPSQIVDTEGTSITGWVALLVALFSASSVTGSLRRAIRTMFGLTAVPESIGRKLSRRVLGILVLFVGLLTTAALTLLATVLRDWIATEFSVSLASLFSALSVVVPILVDMAIFVVMVRTVSLVRPPGRDMLGGAIISASGAFILRTLGTSIVGNVTGPILTATTSLVTIIVWVNLLGWTTLLACAWTANPPAPGPTEELMATKRKERPNYITMSDPETLEWDKDLAAGDEESAD